MEFLNAVWEKLWTSASKWLFHNGKLNEEMEVLLKKTEAMRSLQEDVMIALESLEHRHKKKRKREVDIWLREVQRKKVEIEKREQEVKESMDILQWRLRRLVRRDIREVSQLFEQGKFHEGLSISQESQGEVRDYSEEIRGIVQAGPSMSSTVLDHHWTSEDLSEEDSLEYFLEENDLSKRDKHHEGLLTGKDQSPEEVQKNSEEVAHGVFEGPAVSFVEQDSSSFLYAVQGGAKLEPEVERRRKEEDTPKVALKTNFNVKVMKTNFNVKVMIPRSKYLSSKSGTFMDGDLLVNRDGVRVVSNTEPEAAPPIKPTDNQLDLADLYHVRVIGKGNGGIVQLVQHKFTGQFFACKFIPMNIEDSARRLIAQELKINQSLQCPYLVMCYQSFYDSGSLSVILEYMDGGSLADFLKKVKKIPEQYLAAICKQVLKGLMYLHHEKHIIHMAMKPSNLLINHRGEVKITDFGVSAILANTSGQANTFVGTYNYMSPERIVGEKYGYKSDIWSLGLVLLECVSGRFPYSPVNQDEGWINVFELIEAIVDRPPARAPSDQCSPEFCSFIEACVQKDPKDRLAAHELMAHPFMLMYEEWNVDLASYFTNAGSPLANI